MALSKNGTKPNAKTPEAGEAGGGKDGDQTTAAPTDASETATEPTPPRAGRDTSMTAERARDLGLDPVPYGGKAG